MTSKLAGICKVVPELLAETLVLVAELRRRPCICSRALMYLSGQPATRYTRQMRAKSSACRYGIHAHQRSV